jgi:hypothetical protein
MRSVFTLGFLGLAGLSAAQDAYNIDTSKVSDSDKQTWCDNQKAQCPLICLLQPGVDTMTTIQNDCNPDDLSYSCICANNISPNLTEYSQTIPFYKCQEWGNECVKNCNGDNICGDACRADHPCGAQHPPGPNSSVLATMSQTSTASSTARTSVPVTGFGGAAATTAASSSNKDGAASSMLNLGQSYSLAIVFAGLFAGFAIIL